MLAMSMHTGHDSLLPITGALALFGVGEGLFTSPNNSSIMGAAPAEQTGQAAGVLDVMRSFGTSVGVATAATLLAWRLAVLTGRSANTLHAPPQILLGAARDVVVTFALFALVASALSWSRPHQQRRADAMRAGNDDCLTE